MTFLSFLATRERVTLGHLPVLSELRHVKQNEIHLTRRCFSGSGLHLNTWEDEAGSLVRFQLGYPGDGDRRWALLWEIDAGFERFAVDDGETSGAFHKASPQLIHAHLGDFSALASAFSGALGNRQCRKPAPTAVLRLIEESVLAI